MCKTVSGDCELPNDECQKMDMRGEQLLSKQGFSFQKWENPKAIIILHSYTNSMSYVFCVRIVVLVVNNTCIFIINLL